MRAAFVADAIAGLKGVPAPDRIRLISGGARNPLLVAIKANAFGRPVTVVDVTEATALGAALLGGVAAGLWPTLEGALSALDRREHVVEPDDKLVRLYKNVRLSVFDQLQSALWPADSALTRIAEGAPRSTA
jgi:xylulokinase